MDTGAEAKIEMVARKQMLLSWEMVFAVMVNVIIAVWFITTSQANQDVKIEAHSIRIAQNEKLLQTALEERIMVARLEQQMIQLQKDLSEVKELLQKKIQQE